MKRSLALLAGVVLIAWAVANTHAHAEAKPNFDAASIKLDQMRPGDRRMKGGPGTNSPGRVTWQMAWLSDLFSAAFHVDVRHISGPSWISGNDAPLYTFTAVVPPGASKHEFELMLQTFLVERFRVKLHHELKMFPAYDLVIAPGGARLKAPADKDALNTVLTAPKIDSEGFPVLPPGHAQLVVLNRGSHAVLQSFTVSEFAERLANWVTPQEEPTRYVLDKTGLPGTYDFKLKFDQSADEVSVGLAAQAAYGAREQPDDSGGLPNIFKAVEQQLGLRLVKAKGIPLDTIVIDHAEKMPVGN